jgi:hypothetical protein
MRIVYKSHLYRACFVHWNEDNEGDHLPALLPHLVDHLDGTAEGLLEASSPTLRVETLPLETSTFVEALLVEVCTDSVSTTKLFDLAESAANVTTVLDLDSFAECRTGSEVETPDWPDLWSVEAVQGV